MTTPFVGRAQELRALRSELEVAAGQGSRIVLVTGEPGVGKTRLLSEFRAASARRATCLVGRGSPLGTAIPFSLLAEAIQAHLRELPAEDVEALSTGHRAELAGILPAVAAPRKGEAPSRLAVLEALAGLIGRLSERGPLVLLLDDVHQADPSTWELLGYLGRNPVRSAVLVVASSRPEPPAGDPTGAIAASLLKDGLATELPLAPLERADVAVLASEALGAVDEETAGWLFERTRGNPLFTVGLLEELAQDPTRRVVPVSVKERVRVSVAELPAEAVGVLELAAVLGHSFSLRTLAGLVEERDMRWLDELIARGFLVERGDPDGAAFDFAHPLVQEAIYKNVGPARRRELHRHVAGRSAGEPIGVRAYHAARGALPGDVEAFEIVRAAAREAEENQSHREALAHLRAALDLLPTQEDAGGSERAELLSEIAWQADSASDHTIGVPALRELAGLVGQDPVALASAKIRLASFLATGAGDLEEAGREASEAVRLFREAGAEGRVPGALNELAWIRGEGGDLAGQIGGSSEALALAEAHGEDVAIMHALGALGHALGLTGRGEEAIAAGRRGLELALASGDRSQIGWHTGVLAESLMNSGRPLEAAEILDGLLASGPSASDVAYFARARLNWYLGRWPEALADCRAVQAMHPGAPSVHSAWTSSLAGLLEVAMGNPAAAPPHLAQAERAYAGRDFYTFSALHDWAGGCAAWLRGEAGPALERLVRAAAQLERLGACTVEAQILPDLIEVALAAGERGRATAAVDRLRVAAVNAADPLTTAMAAFGTGLLDDEGAKLREAADRASEVGLPFVRARALERLGSVTKDAAGKISALAEAVRLYAALPAPAYEERATAALRSLGPSGRRSAQTVGDLTPREREVAGLAQRGLTSRQIAEHLHLSERTVESHLAHVFGKLRVKGRKELMSLDPVDAFLRG